MPAIALDEAHLSDAGLVSAVGSVLATPRDAPADSFVLHSALELTARSALLPYVRPDRRSIARRRLVELADQYTAFDVPVVTPPDRDFESVDVGAARLADAIAAGDLDETDATASWLGRTASPEELRRLLADTVLTSLAAAAHAPIFLYLLRRVAPRGEISPELLRGLARELARRPEWRLRWVDERPPVGPASGDELFDALASTPRLGEPESSFIHPLMSRIDGNGLAASWLGAVTGGADIADRGRAVLRAAAWSMLDEPGRHAPYGWSHCLTMPQAVLGVADACADPSRALAVAATFVSGFRASLATRELTRRFEAERPAMAIADALEAEPAVAAAAVWHAPGEQLADVVTEVVTSAATHHDAHLVKYTLACLDAAAADPSQRRLYLAAAASLVAWWATADDVRLPT
ncbi:MAG: hypothetical protein AB7Q42_23580 [Acidimicrobiia bacterium]